MRNAAVVSQAMPALDFPAMPLRKHAWSVLYPNYEERMKAMSLYVSFDA